MNPVFLEGNSQQYFSISTTASQSNALENGFYDVWSTVDCYLRVDETATGVTAANGYLLFKDNVVTIQVDTGRKIGAITATGTGTISLHRVG